MWVDCIECADRLTCDWPEAIYDEGCECGTKIEPKVESGKQHICKTCSHFVDNGYRLDPDPEYGSNPAKQPSCFLFSHHDFDYDYTSWWPTLPTNHCSWWKDREEK